MKIVSYEIDGVVGFGVVVDGGIVGVSEGFRGRFGSVREVLAGDGLDALAADVAGRAADFGLEGVRLLPPVVDPPRIFCVGINYPKRYPIENTVMPPPENIILFAKLDGTLVGHGVPLEIPVGKAADTFDYEGEIVVVIGKGGRHIREEDALDHVAGYTIMNDGSVRGWQKHSVHAGKNFANSGGCGPWLVTADEMPEDYSTIGLQTRLNGEVVQDTTAAEMVFAIPALIAYISHTIDLRPGDLIATGSPEGSGGSRQPQRFLRAGDLLEIEVPGIGVLRNRVGV